MEMIGFDSNTGRLAICGEMTIYQATQLKEAILGTTAGAPINELDLSNVTELDTAGLQLLICLQRDSDRVLKISGSSAAVQSVLDLLGLPQTLTGKVERTV